MHVTAKASSVSLFLRNHLDQISRQFENIVLQRLAELRRLPHGAVIDHLPEFLDRLADWIDAHAKGEEHTTPFLTLADGHALTRLGFGVTLETLTQEYVLLRNVILTELLAVPTSDDVRRELLALNLGMDNAVMLAVRRFTASRDELRERFIAILGHDLRGPLNALSMGAFALVEDADLDAKHVKIAARMGRAVERMDRMIGDVLDFARGHLGGGIPTNPVRVDLAKLCEAAVDEVLATKPDRVVRVEIEGDVAGHFDPDRVSQVLGNLLGNAIEHGADPIVLRAWEDADRRTVFTSVSSRGAQIPPQQIPKLFEPFRRQRKSTGLGLGLYIVQQIAIAHGGHVSVTSDAEATTFTICWPRIRPERTPTR